LHFLKMGSSSHLVCGDRIEVEWPCMSDGGETRSMWSHCRVTAVESEGTKRRPRYLLQFDDGGEAWNSLSKFPWRHVPWRSNPPAPCEGGGNSEVCDETGFVHTFDLDESLVCFCDWLHDQRHVYGDTTRGDCASGEALGGGLVSVVVRRDALPHDMREVYISLHQRCIEEVHTAWPNWVHLAGGRSARVRPSQDLRLLQYSDGAQFKAHVDSGWACQALVYLNENFSGGCTQFPNLKATYCPRRGRVLLWRSLGVGHKGAVAGSHADHPAMHVACSVSGGTKRSVSLNFVLA